MKENHKRFLKYVAFGCVCMAIGGVLAIGGIACFLHITPKEMPNLARFLGARVYIEKHYVDDVDDTALMDGAISGMVKSLGDPHSMYLPPKLYQAFEEQTNGEFDGIGVVMGFKDDKIIVLKVIEDTPAAKAGITAGDAILSIDGQDVSELQPDEAAEHIRGKKGTVVKLMIRHKDGSEEEYSVTRDAIHTPSVAGRMLPDGMGYIRIGNFAEKTGEEFKKEYEELEAQGMKGLILDLRENPGGLVKSCVDVASEIVPKGTVVTVKNRNGDIKEYDSPLENPKYPIVVLIDGNSASAAEILAGALHDTRAATLVGEKSYGKGSVQVVLPMFEDDAMKLTIARYYTPSGTCIDGVGIQPDVEIALPEDATEDVQLKKAQEVLGQKIARGEILLPEDDSGDESSADE